MNYIELIEKIKSELIDDINREAKTSVNGLYLTAKFECKLINFNGEKDRVVTVRVKTLLVDDCIIEEQEDAIPYEDFTIEDLARIYQIVKNKFFKI
jgi:hypothetical protein